MNFSSQGTKKTSFLIQKTTKKNILRTEKMMILEFVTAATEIQEIEDRHMSILTAFFFIFAQSVFGSLCNNYSFQSFSASQNLLIEALMEQIISTVLGKHENEETEVSNFVKKQVTKTVTLHLKKTPWFLLIEISTENSEPIVLNPRFFQNREQIIPSASCRHEAENRDKAKFFRC